MSYLRITYDLCVEYLVKLLQITKLRVFYSLISSMRKLQSSDKLICETFLSTQSSSYTQPGNDSHFSFHSLTFFNYLFTTWWLSIPSWGVQTSDHDGWRVRLVQPLEQAPQQELQHVYQTSNLSPHTTKLANKIYRKYTE